MPQIRKITKQTDNRFVNLYELEVTYRTGGEGKYFMASRIGKPEDLKLVTQENHPDGVGIYALYGENHDRVVLVRQYRYPIGGFIYEFPAGLVEKGESFREAAVRELHEETGLTLHPLDVPPEYEAPRFMTVGLTDESCAVVYGYAEGTVSRRYMEDTEEIEIVLADREEVRRLLREERMALMCAYQLMHFLADEDPFRFLRV